MTPSIQCLAFFLLFLIKMKNILSLSFVAFLIAGCNTGGDPTHVGELDLSSAEKQISTKIKNIENVLNVHEATPANYNTEYKRAHLTRLAEAIRFFDGEVANLKENHLKSSVLVDRSILDAQKELKDLGGSNKEAQAKLIALKSQKAEEDKHLSKSIKLINSRKKDRINALNASYAEILMTDFKTFL
ncbi:hypothetical protein OTK49_00645 [Vibrio coralliirubri]|uniref:hypothetical protein n=1 Tax=Vibrio coralliirubri TaxID=1516159 RepID=UPI00228514F5|nr:hypothetical protein [Vibrio coralliirubri]MCY9861050.1 hypothetical protein [Vibrio coralliirubri]